MQADTAEILVIKLGALGDFILALGAMQAIRRHHKDASLALLTTPGLEGLAGQSKIFDRIWLDERCSPLAVWRWLPLLWKLRRARFRRVYDLQWSTRTAWYFRALARPGTDWVGVVPGASHYFAGAATRRHIVERQRDMLKIASIREVAPPSLDFLTADLGRFRISQRYALLVPGSSKRGLAKRWPAACYADLAEILLAEGLLPILICGPEENDLAAEIIAICPAVMNIDTNLNEIAALARSASVAIANDTGPGHLIAAVGCPLVSLFSGRSDAVKMAPLGASVQILKRQDLADLPVAEVAVAAKALAR